MPGYAAFAATHAERLVRSLVAETGLPRAAAQEIADDVLARAWERGVTFPDGAAYGWLRVAARHRAADPTSAWAEAADTALVQATEAVSALAALPAGDRALLRLRYVEGLLPTAIAERLGTTAADVLDRLDRAHTGAARGLTPRPRVSAILRPVAAVALGGATAMSFLLTGAHTGAPLPPSAAARPAYGSTPLDNDPVDAVSHDGTTRGQAAAVADDLLPAIDVSDLGGLTDDEPGGARRCALRAGCVTPPKVAPNQIHVPLPGTVGQVYGHPDYVVPDAVPASMFCDTVPAPPAGVAKCVPGTNT
jgi:DNA-directed RNA polymerase specialized sigma24 family protein